jgi:CYTH domain-containing protein
LKHLEIERKFLLKALPTNPPDEIIQIDQWYFKNSRGIWERARTWFSDAYDPRWIHTIKKSVSKGVNIEDEKDLTKIEFDNFVKRCMDNQDDSKFINKERHIYKFGELKWELDVFDNGYHLIVAEIEIPTKGYKISIPDFIKPLILLEVTGMKQFSNRNLSINVSELSFNI